MFFFVEIYISYESKYLIYILLIETILYYTKDEKRKKCNIMNNDIEYSSLWYTRFQGILCLLVFLTWGLGDALTSIYMVEQQGLMYEGNIIVRYIIAYYGTSTFFMLKTGFTLLILLTPFILKEENTYWMINGYLFSFIIGGGIAMILNMQAAMNQPLLILPQHNIMIYISSLLIMTNIGEFIDTVTHIKTRSFFYCALNDLRSILSYIDIFEQRRRPGHA